MNNHFIWSLFASLNLSIETLIEEIKFVDKKEYDLENGDERFPKAEFRVALSGFFKSEDQKNWFSIFSSFTGLGLSTKMLMKNFPDFCDYQVF